MPVCPYGVCMVFAYVSMVCPWCVSMECVHGVCMVCVHGVCMVFPHLVLCSPTCAYGVQGKATVRSYDAHQVPRQVSEVLRGEMTKP